MCLLQIIFYAWMLNISNIAKVLKPNWTFDIWMDRSLKWSIMNRLAPFSVPTHPTNLFLSTHLPFSLPQGQTICRFVYIIISAIKHFQLYISWDYSINRSSKILHLLLKLAGTDKRGQIGTFHMLTYLSWILTNTGIGPWPNPFFYFY